MRAKHVMAFKWCQRSHRLLHLGTFVCIHPNQTAYSYSVCRTSKRVIESTRAHYQSYLMYVAFMDHNIWCPSFIRESDFNPPTIGAFLKQVDTPFETIQVNGFEWYDSCAHSWFPKWFGMVVQLVLGWGLFEVVHQGSHYVYVMTDWYKVVWDWPIWP